MPFLVVSEEVFLDVRKSFTIAQGLEPDVSCICHVPLLHLLCLQMHFITSSGPAELSTGSGLRFEALGLEAAWLLKASKEAVFAATAYRGRLRVRMGWRRKACKAGRT